MFAYLSLGEAEDYRFYWQPSWNSRKPAWLHGENPGWRGNYLVDSPGGQYHGAYQFLQATWDATANHVGARDLVGVDPHTASPTLQDDMAWALYQWQGSGPWAGDDC